MIAIITASPNKEGLTAACASAALQGVLLSGETGEVFDLCDQKIAPCRVCNDGWGNCRVHSKCVIDDGLPALQQYIEECYGFILITPVYFGQPSERMTYFLNRFRRCEFFHKSGSSAAGKPTVLVAAAGGSGNGTASCLAEMESWCRHVGAVPGKLIGVTMVNKQKTLEEIRKASADLHRADEGE